MGRRSHTRRLAVWMNGELTGHWSLPSGNGPMEFAYDSSWLESPSARAISLSMPLRPSNEPYRDPVNAYFDNLLPDNRAIRERLQRRFHAGSTEPFDLLSEVGRDCVGAIQLLPEGSIPEGLQRIQGRAVTADEIGELLSEMLGSTFGHQEARDDDAFRISLAGAQEKTAFLRNGDVWMVPHGTTPTTHIFKLPMGIRMDGIDLSTSVENEWLCSEIIREFGIDVAHCRMESFGSHRVLVVERFDRRLSAAGTWWLRLPQEDFCQATGTPPGLKYESDGGPGIRRIMDILLGSTNAEKDRLTFFRTQILFWVLGAIDGHAKNFSLFLEVGGSYRLAPLYDILSAYPVTGRGHGKLPLQKIKMAMAVYGANRHYEWSRIEPRHWMETGRRCGIAEETTRRLMTEIGESAKGVLERVGPRIPRSFPEGLQEAILSGVISSARRLCSLEKQP
jgi:serine/threonine-protein kinase HipA